MSGCERHGLEWPIFVASGRPLVEASKSSCWMAATETAYVFVEAAFRS